MKKNRRLFGLALKLVGLLMLVIAGGLSLALRHAAELLGGAEWVVYLLAACFGALGYWLWKAGKQLRVLSVDEAMAKDKRAPILYLRSFQSDHAANKAQQDGISAKLVPMTFPQNMVSEEEQIAEVMNEYGPFVAIGRPGELLPQLGAARLYATDDTWQQIVRDFLSSSSLIIMRVGGTEGFWWEVANVSTLPDPRRVIFLLPETKQEYEQFRQRAEAHLLKPLPVDYQPNVMTDRNFGGFLLFDSEWNPQIQLCDTAINTLRYSVAADLRTKLASIFDTFELKTQLIQAPPMRRVLAGALDSAIFITLGYLYFAFLQYTQSDNVINGAVVPVILFSIYFGAMEASPWQATPAKKMLGLVTRDGSGVSLAFLPSLFRALIKFIEIPTCLWIMSVVLIFMGKRAIHDLPVNGTVLYRSLKVNPDLEMKRPMVSSQSNPTAGFTSNAKNQKVNSKTINKKLFWPLMVIFPFFMVWLLVLDGFSRKERIIGYGWPLFLIVIFVISNWGQFR